MFAGDALLFFFWQTIIKQTHETKNFVVESSDGDRMSLLIYERRFELFLEIVLRE